MIENNNNNQNLWKCKQHKNNDQTIIKFCISEQCDLLAPMCSECEKNHNHPEKHTIDVSTLQEIVQFAEISKEQQVSIKNWKNILALMKNHINLTLRQTINGIFEIIDSKLSTYEKKQTDLGQVFNTKGAELKKIYKQKKTQRKNGKQINPVLIKQVLQFKVLFKQFLSKLNEMSKIANLFDDLTEPSQKKLQNFNFQPVQLELSSIKFSKDLISMNPNYQTSLKELKKINEIIMNNQTKKQKESKSNQITEYKQALIKANQTIEYHPLHFGGYYEKAYILFESKKFIQSFINYSISIELEGNVDYSFNNRGLCLNSLKLYNEAIASFQKSIQINKKYPNSYLNKGVSYQSLERHYQALACYNKSLSIDKHYKNAQIHKSLILKYIESLQQNPQNMNISSTTTTTSTVPTTQ